MSIIGFSTKVSAVSGRLIVTEPINPLLVASIAGLVMWPIIAELARQPSRRGRLAIWATIACMALGFFMSACRLTLNRAENTATIADFFFFGWHTRTMPLDRLTGVSISTGSTTSAIQLHYADGHTTLMSERNQSGGKDDAVLAINAYLGRKPDTD